MTGDGAVGLPVRRSARVILLDRADNTLLLRYIDDTIYIDPADPGLIDYWVTPGGGLEDGEDHEQAAQRELAEETGFRGLLLHGPVARRRYVLLIRDRRTQCVEHLFIARHDGLKPDFDISGQAADELDVLHDVRWWSRGELQATGEVIFPAALDQLIGDWLTGSLSATPIDLP